MLLSIVIPVYNAGKYIEKCLNSIWNEDLPADDFEVICVDDCSSDNSVTLLKSVQKQHKNLKVLQNSENLRAGGARNYGVREAVGEYIIFIDADDYFHPNGLRKIVEYVKLHRLDVLMFDHVRDIQGGVVGTQMIHYNKNQQVFSGREFATSCLVPFSSCGYIFKRDLMINNRIWFAEKVTTEDIDWSFALLLKAKTVQYQPIIGSHFVIIPNSVTGFQHASVKTVFDIMKTGVRILRLSNEYKADNACYQLLLAVAKIMYDRGVKQMLAIRCRKEKVNAIHTYMGIPEFQNNAMFLNTPSLRFVYKHPQIFAILSDMAAPLISRLVVVKRKCKGRIAVK